MIHEITDDNFEAEVARSPLPCVIEFTANWCTMCDAMAPTFAALDARFDGQVKFCMVNTDEQKGLRIKFAVASMPYIVYVSDGEKTPLFDEIVTQERLEERIHFMLDGGEAPTTTPLR